LALIGLVFQVTALDHWKPAIEDVRGIERTHFHATHCHGAAAGCAEGAAAPSWLNASPAVIPLPPPARPALATRSEGSPPEAPVTDLLHPPRHA
jgi:hypothetical protein